MEGNGYVTTSSTLISLLKQTVVARFLNLPDSRPSVVFPPPPLYRIIPFFFLLARGYLIFNVETYNVILIFA